VAISAESGALAASEYEDTEPCGLKEQGARVQAEPVASAKSGYGLWVNALPLRVNP